MGLPKRDASTLNPRRRGQDALRQWFDHIAGEAKGGEMAMTHREEIARDFEEWKASQHSTITQNKYSFKDQLSA
jgi:hypothetical protein